MEALQHILRNWSQVANMGVILLDENNETIAGPYGFPPYCHHIYDTEKGRLGCMENMAKEEASLLCHAGLREFTIMVRLPGGRQLGKSFAVRPYFPVLRLLISESWQKDSAYRRTRKSSVKDTAP